jgi:hypothetical protein
MPLLGPDTLLNAEGQLTAEAVEELLVEIISGRYLFTASEPPGALYASRCPTVAEQDQGRIVYVRAAAAARTAGMLDRAALEKMAVEQGLLDAAQLEEKVQLLKMIERNAKARELSRDPTQRVELAAETTTMQKRIIAIQLHEQELYVHSVETRAEECRTSFWVFCCTLRGEFLEAPVWETWETYQETPDVGFLIDARKSFLRVSTGLPITIIRAVARHPAWRARWKSACETGAAPFEGAVASWDANKTALAYWSSFYDSIYKHPDCPPDKVVNDDVALEDWLNEQIMEQKRLRGQMVSNARQRSRKAPAATMRDGLGNRKPMARISETTQNINEPYRVRTPSSRPG